MVAAVVGFSLPGAQRDRTAAQPCLWNDHCNKGDYANWLTHANQWMFAVLQRMKTPAELRSMAPMVKKLAGLTRTNIGFLEGFRLTQDTMKLVHMSVNLKEIAEQLGHPVQVGEVTKDLGGPIIQLPIPEGVREELGEMWSFDRYIQKMKGQIEDILKELWMKEYAPLIAIGLVLFLVASSGRRF